MEVGHLPLLQWPRLLHLLTLALPLRCGAPAPATFLDATASTFPAATGCFTQLREDGATCELAGLSAISSLQGCQAAIDYVNAAETNLERPGGPVTEVDYSFHPSGCYSSCAGEALGNGLPHYYCGRFNANNGANHTVDIRKKIYVYCSTMVCCSCSNGFPDLDGCPRNSCRACHRSYSLVLGHCMSNLLINSFIFVAVLACICWAAFTWVTWNRVDYQAEVHRLRGKAH